MPSMVLWVALAACQKRAPPGTASPPLNQETAASSATGTTGDTAHEYTNMEKVPLGPAITIVGQTAEELGQDEPEYVGHYMQLAGDVWGDGHAVLVTGGWSKTMFYRRLPDAGQLRSTQYDAAIVGGSDLRPAGDVNQDGFDDIWNKGRLFLGPLDGDVDFETEWYARIGDGITDWTFYGGFDADGDGWTDAVTFASSINQAVVHYGPFEAGEVRLGWYAEDVDRAQLTDFDATCDAPFDQNNWVAPDFFGPGRPAIALGNSQAIGYYCQAVVQIYDISGPRGRHVTDSDDELIVWDSYLEFFPAGDLDGDGTQDLVTRGGVVLAPDKAKGKLRDQLADVSFEPVAEAVRATGDMDGDGRSELMVKLDHRFADIEAYSSRYWLVPGSALQVGEPIDLVQTSVPLLYDDFPVPGHWIDFTSDPWVSADLDGDGKAEIAVGDHNVLEGGRIFIWRVADLFP